MSNPRPTVGPVYDRVQNVLESYHEYTLYRHGKLTHREFAAFLDSSVALLVRDGLSVADVLFAMRYPRSDDEFVRESLTRLAAAGILPCDAYSRESYDAATTLARNEYEHGPYLTSIFPEEARLLFAISDILRPQSVLVLGSYYGYWAYWMVSALARTGGRAVLVDPNPRAQVLAERNLVKLQLADTARIVTQTGEQYLSSETRQFDCLILDAEGSRSHADPEHRGKAIYAPLLRAALPRLAANARIVCHNILLTDTSNSPLFRRAFERSREELAAFLSLITCVCDSFVECPSTHGIGAARIARIPTATAIA